MLLSSALFARACAHSSSLVFLVNTLLAVGQKVPLPYSLSLSLSISTVADSGIIGLQGFRTLYCIHSIYHTFRIIPSKLIPTYIHSYKEVITCNTHHDQRWNENISAEIFNFARGEISYFRRVFRKAKIFASILTMLLQKHASWHVICWKGQENY